MNNLISKQEIEYCHNKIKKWIKKTPVLQSSSINKIAGCELFFKCENFQKVGAFKFRGASNAISNLKKEQLANGVCTHSSGNHAQAVTLAARMNNTSAYIVMPKNAPLVKVKAVEEYGAEVFFCESNQKAREEMVQTLIKEKGCHFIHPYDNKDIICGQATAAKELIEEITDLDNIFCPVGGGGLLAGSLLAASYFAPKLQVFGAEPSGADDAYRSLKANKIMPSIEPRTIADGLLTSLGKLNFPIIKRYVQAILLVNDDEIKAAQKLVWQRMKIIIEPSSAVPLAAILKNKEKFNGRKVGVIISGGNVDVAL